MWIDPHPSGTWMCCVWKGADPRRGTLRPAHWFPHTGGGEERGGGGNLKRTGRAHCLNGRGVGQLHLTTGDGSN